MAKNGLHIGSSGSVPRTRSQSASTIRAEGQAKENYARVIGGVVILGILAVSYLVAMFNKIPEAGQILLVVGSGLGVLLGKSSKSSSNDE